MSKWLILDVLWLRRPCIFPCCNLGRKVDVIHQRHRAGKPARREELFGIEAAVGLAELGMSPAGHFAKSHVSGHSLILLPPGHARRVRAKLASRRDTQIFHSMLELMTLRPRGPRPLDQLQRVPRRFLFGLLF